MKTGFTDITIVLDRSGSMQDVRTDTIGGVNTFLNAQRAGSGQCVVSLVQFDDEYEPLYSARDIKDAPLLTLETFVPRGWTALFDAIGRTVIETGRRLSAMSEEQRPEKVIFVIVTDGFDNVSKEFTQERVAQMNAHQRTVYGWDFVFIGANQDAVETGKGLGISAASSMTYAANAAGTQQAFTSASNYTLRNRSVTGQAAGASSFTAEDRDEQTKAGAP
jgi:Mg-chelatase subunit ChlD